MTASSLPPLNVAWKRASLDAVRAQLAADLDVMIAAAHTAREAATHPEMRPENDKDTRGIEAGYLAGAQAARALEMKKSVADVDALLQVPLALAAQVSLLSLVAVVEEMPKGPRSDVWFLCPHGGGKRLTVDSHAIQVLTPMSPLGQALWGKRAGDLVELSTGPRVREIEIVAVC